jgi:zinc transporter ZupT
MFWVGILLLVSAGSFLYVACMHILPEVFGSHEHSHSHFEVGDKKEQSQKFSKSVELTAMMLGLFTPYLLMLIEFE